MLAQTCQTASGAGARDGAAGRGDAASTQAVSKTCKYWVSDCMGFGVRCGNVLSEGLKQKWGPLLRKN